MSRLVVVLVSKAEVHSVLHLDISMQGIYTLSNLKLFHEQLLLESVAQLVTRDKGVLATGYAIALVLDRRLQRLHLWLLWLLVSRGKLNKVVLLLKFLVSLQKLQLIALAVAIPLVVLLTAAVILIDALEVNLVIENHILVQYFQFLLALVNLVLRLQQLSLVLVRRHQLIPVLLLRVQHDASLALSDFELSRRVSLSRLV
jgi:hypothetical protein